MNQLNLKEEWHILNSETFEALSTIIPDSKRIINKRDLLLMAQAFLANYQFSKSKKKKEFFALIYKKTMENYYKWDAG